MSLAQVFTVTQPLGGVSTVTSPSISLYFKSINPTMGIDVQIREVANGLPTYNVVKNSRVTVRPTDKYSNGSLVLQTSTDSSVASVFTFKKPIQLRSLAQYAIMIIPNIDSANNGYVLWGASTNDIDIATKVAVQFNGSVGSLITWDPASDRTVLSNEAIKFSVNKCFANTARYHDDSYNYNEEHIVVNDFTAPFTIGEVCYMAQTNFNFVYANLFSAATSGVFVNGEVFYQDNGTGNNATGTIYYANSSALLLNVKTGTVSNVAAVIGLSSGAQGWPTDTNTSISCSSASNTVTFPFTGNGSSSLFYANQSIFLTNSDTTITKPFIVTSVHNDNKTISVSWNPLFSDANCTAGWLRGDNLSLRMNYQGYDAVKRNNFVATFNNSTANTQANQYFHFANSLGQTIIGQSSRARCTSFGTVDLEYHCVVPQFHFDQTEENDHVLYWGGYKSYKTFQSNYPGVWRYITET